MALIVKSVPASLARLAVKRQHTETNQSRQHEVERDQIIQDSGKDEDEDTEQNGEDGAETSGGQDHVNLRTFPCNLASRLHKLVAGPLAPLRSLRDLSLM